MGENLLGITDPFAGILEELERKVQKVVDERKPHEGIWGFGGMVIDGERTDVGVVIRNLETWDVMVAWGDQLLPARVDKDRMLVDTLAGEISFDRGYTIGGRFRATDRPFIYKDRTCDQIMPGGAVIGARVREVLGIRGDDPIGIDYFNAEITARSILTMWGGENMRV